MKLKEACLIVIAAAMLCIFAQPALATSAISVEPAYIDVWQDDEFTVNIIVDPAENEVYGASYTLNFNNTLLKATSWDRGEFLTRDGNSSNLWVPEIDNIIGKFEYAESRVGADVGVGGDPGNLTTITFDVIGEEGVSPLDISDLDGELLYSTSGSILTDIYSGRVGIAQAQAPFVISGYVFYENSSDCNDPDVDITNLNTSEGWEAKTSADSNYYQIVRANGADLNAGEMLRFNVTNGTVSSVANHTIIASEVDDGGLFNFNLTLGTPALNVVINEFVSKSNPEWIELYNPTGSDVSLDGWTIKDGAGNSLADLNGETLPVNGYLVFDFSNKLNDGGDIIYLNASTTTVDKVAYGDWDDGNVDDNAPKPEDDESAGRYPNGADTNNDGADFRVFDTPTRGAENVIDTAPSGSTTVSIENVTAAPGENITVPIMVNNVTNLGGCEINITYNASVVHVANVTPGDMNLLACNINNGSGWMYANAINASGLSGDVVFAYVNFTAVGSKSDTSPLDIMVGQLFNITYSPITHTVINGTFTIVAHTGPLLVTNASASRDTILNDNGRQRAHGTNITVLNVTVVDEASNVSSVTINLSSIGGSSVQPMERITGTDTWTVTTNATDGVNLTHQLTINATDDEGNYNNTVAITLTVLRRGDVCQDNVIDGKDVTYIARYLAGLEPECSSPPSALVGDVVGIHGDPEGDGIVDLMDALYIARYKAGLEGEP